MKSIDWNQMSELGLIEKLNREILHPLGLAISRDPKTGVSESILVADDGFWEYSQDMTSTILSTELVKHKVEQMPVKQVSTVAYCFFNATFNLGSLDGRSKFVWGIKELDFSEPLPPQILKGSEFEGEKVCNFNLTCLNEIGVANSVATK